MSGLWQAIDSVVAARAWPRPPRRCRSSSCSTWPPPRCCWPPAPPGPSRSRPDLGHLPVIGAIAAAVIALAVLARRRLASPLRRLWAAAQQGGAILRTPGRYLRRVAALQAGAWACRIAVIYLLMAGFGLPASVPGAAVVMALCGASTLVPLTPGGAGTQQVMVAFALSEAATATAVLSFSIGMQAGVTAVNTLLGGAGGDGRVPHAQTPVRRAPGLAAGARLAWIHR